MNFTPKISLTFICRSRIVNIPFEEITHLTRKGNETIIYTTSDQFSTRSSLIKLLNELPADDFFRISRLSAFSVLHIKVATKYKIKVGSYSIHLSMYYRKQLIKSFQQILDRQIDFLEPSMAQSIQEHGTRI